MNTWILTNSDTPDVDSSDCIEKWELVLLVQNYMRKQKNNKEDKSEKESHSSALPEPKQNTLNTLSDMWSSLLFDTTVKLNTITLPHFLKHPDQICLYLPFLFFSKEKPEKVHLKQFCERFVCGYTDPKTFFHEIREKTRKHSRACGVVWHSGMILSSKLNKKLLIH
jgi:hypothetical protein